MKRDRKVKLEIDRAMILVTAVNTLLLFLVYRVKMSNLLVTQDKSEELSSDEVRQFLITISQTRPFFGFSALKNDVQNIGRCFNNFIFILLILRPTLNCLLKTIFFKMLLLTKSGDNLLKRLS